MGGSTKIFLRVHARRATPLERVPSPQSTPFHTHTLPSPHMQASSLIVFTPAILPAPVHHPLLLLKLPMLFDMVSHSAQPRLRSHQRILCSSSIFDALLSLIFEYYAISLLAYVSPYFGLMSFTLVQRSFACLLSFVIYRWPMCVCDLPTNSHTGSLLSLQHIFSCYLQLA